VACWAVALFVQLTGLPFAGVLPMGLYQFYGVAAFLGWLTGNVYVHRTRGLPKAIRRRVLLVYLLGPPSLFYILGSMAPVASQAAVPLAPVYATGVFAILFLVPVTLRSTGVERTGTRS
jgi:hypothetical protein